MATHARRVLQTLMQPLHSHPHKRCMLEEVVEASLLRSTAGVHVLADPPSMYPGSVSVVVRSIIRRMQHQLKVAGALDLTFDEATTLAPHYESFTFPALASQKLGLWNGDRSLSDMLDLVDKQDYNHDRERSKGKPVVVLIDNYDHAHRALGWKKSHAQLVALAEESALTKRFVVLVIVADPALRREILMWNDGQKIYPCN